MTTQTVPRRSVASDLSDILGSPEVARLVNELQATRWTGRPGYPLRSMIGMALAKSLYAIPTWTRVVALVREHAALAAVIAPAGDVPSVYSCYRFAAKLREHSHLLDGCIDGVIARLHDEHPGLGENVAIDASDMPAYANGQRFVSKGGRERSDGEFSDADATWGHRSAVSTRKGGGFYGYRLHMAVDTATDLPLAWSVETASANESTMVAPLLDKLGALGVHAETCAMDKGYDVERVYGECAERGVAPVIPLRQTERVKRGEDKLYCFHGPRVFAGADYKRKATKWRCRCDQCTPRSVWVKADRLHPLIPRESPRWKKLYSERGAVEREFGRLKNEWALAPLRVRRIERVRLHADLTILAKLSRALARARAVPLAA